MHIFSFLNFFSVIGLGISSKSEIIIKSLSLAEDNPRSIQFHFENFLFYKDHHHLAYPQQEYKLFYSQIF